MEIQAMEIEEPLAASLLTVAVAVNGSKRSKRVLQWALNKFADEGMVHFRLMYVRPKITCVPTAMGNYIPISKVRDDIAFAYIKEVEWQTNSMLLAYKHLFFGRKVEVNNIVIEADDVADALSTEIANLKINKLVIGASSQNIFSRLMSVVKSDSSQSMSILHLLAILAATRRANASACNEEPTMHGAEMNRK